MRPGKSAVQARRSQLTRVNRLALLQPYVCRFTAKEYVMRSISISLSIAAAALIAIATAGQAQTPPGPARAGASAPTSGPAGARGGMGPRMGRDFTPGWSMMTPQERDEHHKRLSEAKTAEECRAVMDEHRKLMTERAKERGMGTMRGARRDACAGFKR